MSQQLRRQPGVETFQKLYKRGVSILIWKIHEKNVPAITNTSN